MCVPWDSQGNEKMQFLFLLLFALTFLSEMKYDFQEMQNKKPFEIILHVERVTSLQAFKTTTELCTVILCRPNFAIS